MFISLLNVGAADRYEGSVPFNKKRPAHHLTERIQSQNICWHLLLSSGLLANFLRQITVGNGFLPFRPQRAARGLVGKFCRITAGGEFHPAPKLDLVFNFRLLSPIFAYRTTLFFGFQA
jgi:hypothetical protein